MSCLTDYSYALHRKSGTDPVVYPIPVQGTFVSMGVYSDGSYKVPAGLIYSFPVTCENGEWKIVQGMVFSLRSSFKSFNSFISAAQAEQDVRRKV